MDGAKFNFVPQQERESVLTNKKIVDKLMQWSMKGSLKLKHYNFNQQFLPYQKQEFVDAFFRDPNVYTTLDGFQASLSESPSGESVEKVEYELVPCYQTSMAFFDRVLDPENQVVHQAIGSSGELKQCMETYINGFPITNHLRALILDEESEMYGLYSEAERNEFIFRLLGHLVLGGQCCQWDDYIQPYLDLTRAFYKDILSVEREEGMATIRVRSVVLKVTCFDKSGRPVYPRHPENLQNFCYLIVDPFKRTVTAFTHSYGTSFTM